MVSEPNIASRTPHQIEIDLTPVQVANNLQHLPGVAFFDTSTEFDSTAISIIAARPSGKVRGSLFSKSDRDQLETVIANHAQGDSFPDFGFPCGGLVGAVDYDGAFEFGIFTEMLIYEHCSEIWHEIGSLSREIRNFERPENSESESFNFVGTTSQEDFCSAVSTAQKYISAGDIYQVNLSHRFQTPCPASINPLSLYQRLRDASPAPFSAFLEMENRHVLSSSPEQFLRMSGPAIQTRPIKGTRPRFRNRERDEKSAYDLITSPKEIAELIMITDLERNDLGQICEFGSVEASELLKLERFEHVFHLISTVDGTLRPEVSHIDALASCSPGGSITGAPKTRAREIIAELEPEPRGLYTGAIGILGFNRESRFNIAIRTAVIEDNELHFHVGAGIVADSDPQKEWEETLHKAEGIFRAFS